MTNREITESVNLLKNLFGNELESDLRKFVRSVFNDESLNVGIRYGNDLIVREIKFTSYMVLDEDEGIVMDTKYKPEEFSHNDFNYYFGAEEIIVNNKRGIFFAVIGNEWFKNNLGDEFVEAIIFGDHDIPFIDCMYGSVRVNKPFGIKNYLSSGAIVSLITHSFKNTSYLEILTLMSKSVISDGKNNAWHFGDTLERYNWNNRYYLEESEY